MNDENSYSLSRRTVLAGLGTVGVASAGAGLGTTAFFSDREDFADNLLEAGELDLKVDWQNRYWGADVDEVYGQAGRPFVNAFPDADGDGRQDTIQSRADIAASDPNLTAADVEAAFRAQFANLPDDFDGPVVELTDVKPGDKGCLGMSLHLFDNPGYLWLGGALTGESENGQNEPEADADPTADGAGELADSVEATLWYDDDGDCQVSPGIQGDGDVMVVLDRSGSMTSEAGKFQGAKDGAKLLVDALGTGATVGMVSYADAARLDVGLGSNTSWDGEVYADDNAAVKGETDDLVAGGLTNIGDALQVARDELVNNGTSSTQIMVFLTNGSPTVGDGETQIISDADSIKTNDGIEIYTVAYGSTANASLLEAMSSDPDSQYSYTAADISTIEQVFSQIGQVIAGEEVIHSGTLREVLDALAGGMALDGNRLRDGRQCFVNSTTQQVALQWEVPTSVGNEIQSDSLTFDFAFAADQCRHNDGTNNPFATV